MSTPPRVKLGSTLNVEVYVDIPLSLKSLLIWGEPGIQPDRLDELRQLHCKCFPVKYSDSFYEKIANCTYPSRILYERLPTGPGRIVGFASSIIYQEPFKGYLATLGVRPEWRKRGIAKVLIRCIEAYLFKNYDIEYVELHVLHSNIAAIRLYESLKYTMIAFLEKHYSFEDPETGNRKHDAYLYRKYKDDTKRLRRKEVPEIETNKKGSHSPVDYRTGEPEISDSEHEQTEGKPNTVIDVTETGHVFAASRLE